MTIYLVGNPILDKDSMPFKIKPYLKKEFSKIQFLEFDPIENFPEERNIIFIDTVINLKNPAIFTDAKRFELIKTRNITLHSFDFYSELVLRKKAGIIEKYYIIGIPNKGSAKIISKKTKHLINQLISIIHPT